MVEGVAAPLQPPDRLRREVLLVPDLARAGVVRVAAPLRGRAAVRRGGRGAARAPAAPRGLRAAAGTTIYNFHIIMTSPLAHFVVALLLAPGVVIAAWV